MATQTWTACEDELPDDGTTVLISNPTWPTDPVWIGYFEDDEWRAADGEPLGAEPDSGAPDAEPTHWMHLPEPPAEEGALTR